MNRLIDALHQLHLQAAVDRAAVRKEHIDSAHRSLDATDRINTRKRAVEARPTARRLEVRIKSRCRVGRLSPRYSQWRRPTSDNGVNHARDLTRSLGATIGHLSGVAGENGIVLIEAARRSAMVDVLANQVVFSDVADVIDTQHCSRTNFFLNAEVHLPRAWRAVAGIEKVVAAVVQCR